MMHLVRLGMLKRRRSDYAAPTFSVEIIFGDQDDAFSSLGNA